MFSLPCATLLWQWRRKLRPKGAPAALSEASGFGNPEILGHPPERGAPPHTLPEGRTGRRTLGARGDNALVAR